MAAYQSQLVRPPFQEFCGSQRNVIVRRAMKAVPAHSLFFIKLIRQSVQECIGRQRMMERGVEYSDVRDGREQLPHLANRGDNYRIMWRRQRIEFLHVC